MYNANIKVNEKQALKIKLDHDASSLIYQIQMLNLYLCKCLV